MMGRILTPAAVLALAEVARAASIVYVTEMPAFQDLAPCVQSALKYNIMWQTSSACAEGTTELQSCVCTKNNNLASISKRLSSSVSYSCGSAASDDQATAQSVLSAYCDPSATLSFQTPTAVTEYITDLPEMSYLAPCAQSALKYAVRTLQYDLCQTEAPVLANCACAKKPNSLLVSRVINVSGSYYCSSRTADISSAQAMFAAYCAMDDGTTSFPVPSNPPGDMTYYITDLPQYSSLAPCAAEGLEDAIMSQTREYCPSGPQALASCVCFKDGMTNDVLKTITSRIKTECATTATEDVSSAVGVYNYYCSAAAGQLTAAGVSNSVEQTYPPSRSSSPRETGGTGDGDGGGNGSGNNGSDGISQGDGGEEPSGPGTAVIVGAVVGAIGGLALIGVAIFFIIRTVRKNRLGSRHGLDNALGGGSLPPTPYGGKSELSGDSAAAPPPPASPSPSTLKVATVPAATDTVSLVSAGSPNAGSLNATAFTPPMNNRLDHNAQSALYPPMPNHRELQNQQTGTPPPQSPPRPELQDHGTIPPAALPTSPELYGQAAPQVNRPELQGQGAMYAPPSDAPKLYDQGAPQSGRPELQGQGAMYPTQPQNMSELQGQGTQFHHANPNRPELTGQYGYVPPQQHQPIASPHYPQQQHIQQVPGYYQQVYHPASLPPQSGAPQSGMYISQQQPGKGQGQLHQQASWMSGPVPDFHEMDGQGQGQGQHPGQR